MFVCFCTKQPSSSRCSVLGSALYFALTLILMVIMAGRGTAAAYIAPDDSTELFQLEKIPLQVHDIKELSQNLMVIARRKHDASPASQQASGRLLLLAMQLDPLNPQVHEANKALSSGKNLPVAQDSALNASQARLQFFQRWLASRKAGPEANKLANYLSDATKTLRPETIKNKDLGDWQGTLPPLTQYSAPQQQPPQPPNKEPAPNTKNPVAAIPQKPKPGEKPGQSKSTPDFHLVDQTVFAPFALRGTKKKEEAIDPNAKKAKNLTENQISAVRLKLIPSDPEEANSSLLTKAEADHQTNAPPFNAIDETLRKMLTSRHSNIPRYKAKLTISGGRYSTTNQLNLTGPLALMLEASLANTPLREDLHVLAAIDTEGKLTHPENFWEMLPALRQSNSTGRLIISPESAELMAYVLVYDEPDVFTRWEIFLADDIDQALAFSVRQGKPELTQASAIFESIRALASKTDVTQLTVDYAVRDKLDDIVELEQHHISAQMLLLQGSGKRPMQFNEQTLALELLPIVRELNNTLAANSELAKLGVNKLDQQHESARTKLDQLERLVDRGNDELYRDSIQLANDFRRLMNLMERIQDGRGSEYSREKVPDLYTEMQSLAESLLQRISAAAAFETPGNRKESSPPK